MRSFKLALALAFLSGTALAQSISDVQLRPGSSTTWGAAINVTNNQDISQYNTAGSVVDSFRFLQGANPISASLLFSMSPTGMVAGAATGGRMGAGTINAQGLYLNGVSVGGASGPAGGDLSGTYPNPSLAAIGAATGPLGSATVAPIVTIDTKGRVTALSSATITPAISSITGLGAGCAAWLVTPSSANLRGCLTDESGNGAAYFQGGDIGTPSAGVGTNLTSLNASNLNSGTVPSARGGAGTINGVLSANGAGAVSQGATTGLSDTTTDTVWTPTDGSGAGLTFSSVTARYTKIGKIGLMFFKLTYPATANGSAAQISSLPLITSGNYPANFTAAGSCLSGAASNTILIPTVVANSAVIGFSNIAFGAPTNAALSGAVVSCNILFITQ